jgi:hypothetical protein
MAFEARYLRVKLPSTEIIEPENPEWQPAGVGCASGNPYILTHCHCVTGYTGQFMGGPGGAQLIVSADDLPALKAHLEARLREIERAERAIEEWKGKR